MSYLQLYQIQTTTACELTVLYNQATSNKEKRTVQQRLLAICLYTAQQAMTSQTVVDRVKILDILQNISSRSLQTRKTTKSSLQITNQTSFSFVSIPSYSYPYENTLLQCSFVGSNKFWKSLVAHWATRFFTAGSPELYDFQTG